MVWLGFFFREVACGLINVFTNSLVAIQKAHLYFPPRYPAEACSGARCSDGLGGAGCFGLFFFPLKHELRPVVATRVCASLRPSEAGGALGTPGRAAAGQSRGPGPGCGREGKGAGAEPSRAGWGRRLPRAARARGAGAAGGNGRAAGGGGESGGRPARGGRLLLPVAAGGGRPAGTALR